MRTSNRSRARRSLQSLSNQSFTGGSDETLGDPARGAVARTFSALMQEKAARTSSVRMKSSQLAAADSWNRRLHLGSTGGVVSETPDRVGIAEGGVIPLPAGAEVGVPLQGQATGAKQKWMHTIFVVDRNGRMVQSWTQHDQIFAREGARGPHKIKMNPYDPQKHVWVMDDNLHQLFKFTYDGKLVQTWGEALVRARDRISDGRPTRLAARGSSSSATATPIPASSSSRRKGILMAWGTSSEGKANPGPNEMHTVHSIAIGRDRKLYVSDRTNSRIQIFDENGKYLDMWTNIRRPYHVLMSRDQFLWISDGETHKMLKYDLDRQLLYRWGTLGPLPGRLNGVHQFSVHQQNTSTSPKCSTGGRRSSARAKAPIREAEGAELRHGALGRIGSGSRFQKFRGFEFRVRFSSLVQAQNIDCFGSQ